jgi:hypothetical protein
MICALYSELITFGLSSDNHPELRPNEVSKDISLEPIVTRDLTIRTTVHHTDTVCHCWMSLHHVAVDVKRLIRLSNVLTRVEDDS